jgi:pimeloyl-ACP methyl ester carboxylesterase
MTEKTNPFDLYNDAPLMYDDKGVPMAEAPFTSTADKKRYAVVVPPSKVIPIIFVPGIMGSNLRLKTRPEGIKPDFGDIAWRPDDGVTFMVNKYYHLKAFQRRLLLNPVNTEVDDRADIPSEALGLFTFGQQSDGRGAAGMAANRRLSFTNEMKRRGWGTLMLSSYGPFIGYLEYHLNKMYERGEMSSVWQELISRKYEKSGQALGTIKTDLGITKGGKPLTADDAKKAARHWFPVHAVGYNWLQSAEAGGVYLAKKINQFIDHYKALGYECEKALLVTHSMGGLVARAAVHPDMGKAADKVLGVIHGVQPATGAAAAYARCHQGFEGSDMASGILGGDGPEVAAVFSNSPGALQLLPNVQYGTGWLKINQGTGSPEMTLPKADPYKEIYEERNAWWRLMNPEWIDPNPKAEKSKERDRRLWDLYLKNIDEARDFHTVLGKDYHAHTHITYGADPIKYKAFGNVTWQSTGQVLGNPLNSAKHNEKESGVQMFWDIPERNGRVVTNQAYLKLGLQDEPGDGTVPQRSGNAPYDKAEFVCAQGGYDHQGSYLDTRVQELALYSVARLVSENA